MYRRTMDVFSKVDRLGEMIVGMAGGYSGE